MKRIWILALFIALGLMGCRPPDSMDRSKPASADSLRKGEGGLLLERWDGGSAFSLESLSGKPLLVYVLAPWTDSGEAALAELNALIQAGITVLPVVVDARPESSARNVMISPAPQTAPMVKASESLFKRLGGIRAMPTALLLDASGQVIRQWSGVVPAREIATAWPEGAKDSSKKL